METEAIIPEHGDVANAIGAITSSVSIIHRVEICPDMRGRFGLRGVDGAPSYAELPQAQAAGIAAMKTSVAAAARTAGTSHNRINVTVHDNIAALADGGEVFISQVVEARLTGRPDVARRRL